MQLDKTRIAIRERGQFDLLDLTLRVIAGHAGSLLAWWVVGCLPFAVLNVWLLKETWYVPSEEGQLPPDYLWHMAILIIWEIPLATAPMTIFLGQSLFLEHPTPSQIARALADRWAQILIFPVIVRGLFLFWPVLAFLSGAEAAGLVFLGMFAALGTGVGYFFSPYFNEVLLLERNPLFGGKGGVSTWRRVMSMHGHASGDIFARSLISLGIGSILYISLCGALVRLHELIMLDQSLDIRTITFYCVLTAWFLVGFFTVARFLSYLDLRIRTEGWEVELLLRAEGNRIARQLA